MTISRFITVLTTIFIVACSDSNVDTSKEREVRIEKKPYSQELLKDTQFLDPKSWKLQGDAQKLSNGMLVTVESPAYQIVEVQPDSKYLLRVKASCHETQTKGRMQVNWLNNNDEFIIANIESFDCEFESKTHEKKIVSPDLAHKAIIYASGHAKEALIIQEVSFKSSAK